MSHIIQEDGTYTYEILQKKHLEESTRLLADVFAKFNPLEIYLKTSYELLYCQALAFSKAILDEQLSIIAIDKQTKEIHGIVQAGDAKKLYEQIFEELQLSKDMEIFDELERRFIEHYGELKENDFVQIIMAGVRQDCSGKGLGTKLHQILLSHCGQRGFKHALVEPTNPATHHMYTKKLNGKEFTSIYLPTFASSDGHRLFEHLDLTIPLIVFDI